MGSSYPTNPPSGSKFARPARNTTMDDASNADARCNSKPGFQPLTVHWANGDKLR
jgi:hypothetical protein